MRQKIISIAVYGVTTLALAAFFDGLYSGEPLTHYLVLVHAATVGAILFAIACILSMFSQRLAIACALTAGILSWPYFGVQMSAIPWRSLVSIVGYSDWTEKLTAILMLIISSVYSLRQSRLLFRDPAAS